MKEKRRRVFEVLVTHKLLVSAFDDQEAERWVEDHVSTWSGEPVAEVFAFPLKVTSTLTTEERESLPWAANGVSDAEARMTVEEWVEREAKELLGK